MTSPQKTSRQKSPRAKQSPSPPTRFWTGARIALVGGALLVIAVAGSLFLRGTTEVSRMNTGPPGKTASASPPTLSTSPVAAAPAATPISVMDYDIPMLDGKSRRLSTYKNKVVVLDLWATWCGPCRIEIPHLIEIGKQYKGRGVEVIGLTTENPATDAEKVRNFAREFKINYQLGWANGNFALGLMNGHSEIPQTFVVGRDGRLLNQFIGFNAQTSPPQLRAAIEQAIAGSK